VTRPAPDTFETKLDASAWLNAQVSLVAAGAWIAPQRVERASTLRVYADSWLETRDLRPRTRAQYRWLLDDYLLPGLGGLRVDTITPPVVRQWHAGVAPGRPTTRAQAYGLLRTILKTAVSDGLLPTNPAQIDGAGSTKRASTTKVATPTELDALAAALPPRYRVGVLLSSWCALRFGELAELRRGDIDVEARTITVARAVVRVNGAPVIGPPKTDAGVRVVTMPARVAAAVADHLERFVPDDADALVFPARQGGHLSPTALYKVFYPARDAIGRPDLRWHDLRHSGLTLAAQTGATIADLMERAGHTTPGAAMRYQHSAAERQRAIADALDDLATVNVVPLHRAG